MTDQSQKSKPEGLAIKKIEEGDLIDLWKYFQDRADMLKERQWTMGTWIVTLLRGVAAFYLSQRTLSLTPMGIAVKGVFTKGAITQGSSAVFFGA